MAASNGHRTHSPHARRTINIHISYCMPTIISHRTYGLGLTQDRGQAGSPPRQDRGSNSLLGAFSGVSIRYNDCR